LDPGGRRVFVANWGDNTVSIIDTRTDTVVSTVEVNDRPGGMAVHPDGTKLYVAKVGGDTLWEIDTARSTVVRTINLARSKHDSLD
jgi:YVTN family beta-propeller protein